LPGSFFLGLADAPGAAPSAPAAPAAPPAAPTGTQVQQTPAASQSPFGCGQGGIMGMVPFLFIFVVFYFMLIRPQQKKQREQQDWLKSLKKGDEVVTTGGLIGKITGLSDTVVTLEVQEKVRLRVLRSAVAGRPPAPGTSSSSAPAAESK
jgi:preprotein translocase subunit YajC